MDVVKFAPPAPAPPAGAAPAAPRMPMARGVARPVTPAERAVLEPIGWKDGDPVPGDLAQHLAAAAARDDAELRDELAALAGRPPLQFDAARAVDAGRLAPGAQAELARKFAEMRDAVAAGDPGPAQLPPGVAEAMAKADSPAPPELPTAGEAPAAGAAGAATGAADPPPRVCPHCRYDLARTDLPEPTDEEKRRYLTACLSGARYARESAVMGGHVRFAFREILASEIAQIWAQVERELPAGAAPDAYPLRAYYYMMIAATASVARGGQLFELPAVGEAAVLPGASERPLEAMRDWLRDRALPTESLWRVYEAEYRKFRGLLGRLEAMAADPDFFAGIPGPA